MLKTSYKKNLLSKMLLKPRSDIVKNATLPVRHKDSCLNIIEKNTRRGRAMLQNQLHNKFVNAFEWLTNALKVIDNDHAYIHQSKLFTVTFKLDITTGATAKATFLTNSVKQIHYRPANIVTSADKLSINVYEGSTVASGGTAVTPVNRNRHAVVATDVVVKTGVTVGTNGTLIQTVYMPGGTGVGQARSGSQLSANNEWVLKESTLYTYEFINTSTETNTVWVELQWYEE